jgi:hypothetical protein
VVNLATSQGDALRRLVIHLSLLQAMLLVVEFLRPKILLSHLLLDVVISPTLLLKKHKRILASFSVRFA